jgi:aminodeoxychorismate synthase component I
MTREPTTNLHTAHLLQPLALQLPLPDYFDLFRHEDYAFFLDSALPSENLGRHSFMGGRPFLVFQAKRQPEQGSGSARCEVRQLATAEPPQHKGSAAPPPRYVSQRVETTDDPFDTMQQLLDRYAVQRADYAATPVPLLAGAIGYLGYEAGHYLERLPDTAEDDLQLPDMYFMFCDEILAHCHQTGESFLSVSARAADPQAAKRQAEKKLDQLRRRIDQLERHPPVWSGPDHAALASGGDMEIRTHFDEASYAAQVNQIKEHIHAGDVYQACMTHRLQSPLYGGDAWNLYRELRRINPAPFASFLQFPEAAVASASPERFLKLDADRVAESRPIKGTRPRSTMPEADLAMRDELAGSIKDQAENIMIVDLVRNDFGRVCRFNSVQVPELMAIEPYATVFQMVSTVRGTLRDDVTPLDLVRACFPGGSMTGAPKIEAMKIIDSLEPVCRGIYSGAIGYLDFSGVLDLSIVIRSFVIKDNTCYYHVGGAIVADSDPRAEYLETMTKARALKQALANLQALDS